jgi:hypothetical protein
VSLGSGLLLQAAQKAAQSDMSDTDNKQKTDKDLTAILEQAIRDLDWLLDQEDEEEGEDE